VRESIEDQHIRGPHGHAAEALTSNAKADERFGKQDFRYLADEDVHLCSVGEKLDYANEENGLVLRRYWTNAW
jgi:transposase